MTTPGSGGDETVGGTADEGARGILHAVRDLEDTARDGARGMAATVGSRAADVRAGVRDAARAEQERRATTVAATVAAATATTTVPGVVRLEPRLADVLHHLRDRAARSLGAEAGVRTDGVKVSAGDDGLRVTVEAAVDHRYRTATVAADVQRAVAAAVTAATGQAVADVTVTVVDIDLDPPRALR